MADALISLTILIPFTAALYFGFDAWLQLLPIMFASLLSYWGGLQLIPIVKELTLKANLYGRDLNKTTNKSV